MSHIISNPHVEKDLSIKFFCHLHYVDRKEIEVMKNGMDPFLIWKLIDYKAFHENVIPVILDKLISNNVKLGYIEFIKETKRVRMTPKGRDSAWLICK
jgi:hypothetical protein